ncbi:MAG: LamG-like jellyroll fold domain-containing protein [Bacteroidia bacterium]
MKKAILFLVLFTASFCNAQVPLDSLKAYYAFGNNLADSSGLARHIQSGSGTFVNDRFGNPLQALQFNGTSDSLILPVPEFSPIQGDFAIAFWFKTNSPEKMNLFSSKQNPVDTTSNFEIQLNNTSSLQTILEVWYQTYIYWNGSGWVQNAFAEGSAGPFTKGQWSLMVIQRVGDTLQVYHNHALYTASQITYYNGTLGDAVDLAVSAAPYKFDGVMDELRLYNRALTQAEIDALYFEHRPFVFTEPRATDAYAQGTNLLAYWEYDDNQVSDSIVVDYRINNGPWQATNHSNLAYLYYHYFPLNYPYGTSIEVRVSDFFDSTKTASSGAFIVSEYEWQNVSPSLPFSARDGSGLLVLNGKMWLLGGWDPPFHQATNYTHNEVWSSTDGINWTFELQAPWYGRHCAAWLVHNNEMWVIGGDVQSGAMRDVWKSADGLNWIQTEDTIPGYARRTLQNYASLNGNLMLYGGQEFPNYVPENMNEVWQSPDGISWTQLPNAPWKPRGMIINSCIDDNGEMWMLGGGRLNDRRCFNDVWKTPDGINWTQVNESAPWGSRYWHTVAWYDHNMWLMAGIVNQTDANDVWYSPDGVSWRELRNTPFAMRHAHSTTIYDSALWVMAGINSNDAWKLVNRTTVGISESPQQIAMSVFPNPAAEIVTIQASTAVVGKKYELFDVLGNVVMSGVLQNETSTLNLQGLPAGMYVLRVAASTAKIIRY